MATHAVSVLCLLLMMLAIRVDSQSNEEETGQSEESFPESYWDVKWSETGSESSVSTGSTLEPFAVAGEIIPGFETSTLIDVAANSWRSGSLRQAAGEMCRSIGPVASQFLGSKVQEVCQPILDSLNTGDQVPELSGVCEDIVREIEDQLNSDEEGSYGGSDDGVDEESGDRWPGSEEGMDKGSEDRYQGSEDGSDKGSGDRYQGSEDGSDKGSEDRYQGSEDGSDKGSGDRWQGSEDGSDKGSDDRYQGSEDGSDKGSDDRWQGSEGHSFGGREIDFGMEFWYTPDYGYFYPSDFFKEILGFAGNSKTETCKKLGSIVYNMTLTGRDILRNITSAAIRHLLPLSLQFCDHTDNDVQVTFGRVLLELFSALKGGQDNICGEQERFNELVSRITNNLLAEFLYDDQSCRDVFSRLEVLGIRANFGFDYDSVESMCLSIQQIVYLSETSEEREREDLSEAGRGFRRVFRAVAGFLHSDSAREGFMGLCNTFQESSSAADHAMCAALEMDNSRELIRQCLNLCGANEDESFVPHDSDYDHDGPKNFSPWEEKFDKIFGWVGKLSSALGRIPGLEDYDLVGIITDVLGYGFTSDIQSVCEVTENRLFYSEDVSVRQLVNGAMDAALQKLIYASPSVCSWEYPSGPSSPDYYRDSFVTQTDDKIVPSDEVVTDDFPWNWEQVTEGPYLGDDMRPSSERYDKPSWYVDSNEDMRPSFERYDKSSWYDESNEDGLINLDILGAAFAFFANLESSDALCNKSLEVVYGANHTKLEQFANKTKDGILKVITDEETCVRFLSTMSDKFGGLDFFGELLSGFESAEQLCFVLTSKLDWEDEERELSTSGPRWDVSMTERPEEPRGEPTKEPNQEREDQFADSGITQLFSFFGRLIKSPSVRRSFEEVCNFFDDDLSDEERESCFALRSGDPEKYFESCLKLEKIFFGQEDGGYEKSWISPTDSIGTYMRFMNEWIQLSMNGANELQEIIEKAKRTMFNRDVPFPDLSDILVDVLDLQHPNPDAICERLGYIVHYSNLTVREATIKMLDSILVSVGRYADNLCFEPGTRYPYESSYSEKSSGPFFEVTGSPIDDDGDSEPRHERHFTESPSFQSDFEVTDVPSWLNSYPEGGEWEWDGRDPFSGRLGGKIFAYLGNFKSPEEICGRRDEEGSGEVGSGEVGSGESDRGEAGSGESGEPGSGKLDRNEGKIADRVVAMRRKLMSVTQNIDVCVGLLEVVTSEMDIFSGVLPGFTDPYSFCQKIRYSFGFRNRGSLSDFSFNDFDNPAKDMAGLLTIGGRLFNSTIKEALLFPCELFRDTPLAMFISSECGVLSHRDPSPLIEQCKSMIVQFTGNDNEDKWYMDGILPSSWSSDDNTSPFGWLGQYMEGMFPVGDLSVLFYEMFGLKADLPGELCSNAESFVSNESMTMQVIFDIGLDASLRYMIRASPKVCQNEGTAGPTEIPTFDLDEVPSFAESVLENIYMNIPGVDPFDAMKAAFTFLGHYNSSDEFCQDTLEALAEYAEPALLDDMINGMKDVVYTLIKDADACETYLDIIQEELSIPFSLGNVTGHADNPSLCRAVVDAFNPEMKSNRSIFTFAELTALSGLAGNTDFGLDSLKTESLSLVGKLYNAGSFRDFFNETCSSLNETDELRELQGKGFSRVCEWATKEHDALEFYKICFAFATVQPWDSYSSVEEESEFDLFGFSGYSKIGEFISKFGTEIFSTEKALYWLQEMFGIDASSPEQVCGSAKQLIANDSLTVPVIFNTTLEMFARHAVQASPWLCRGEVEATAIPTGVPGFEATEIPSWAESVMESVYWNVPGVDPQGFLKVVFSFLTRHDMSDAFCRDSINAVAEGADPAELEGLVNKTKDSIYILVKDADSCEYFMGVIQESLELSYSVGEVVGIGSNREFCTGLTVAFGSASGRNTSSGNDEFRLGQIFDFAAQVDSTGGIRATLRSACDVLDLFNIVPDELKTGYTVACAWSRMASNAEIFYHVCLDFVSESLKENEKDDEELGNGLWLNSYIPDWMRDITGSFGNSVYTHTDTLLWMREVLELDAESPDLFCETARERIEDESIQIHDVVDSSFDIFLRQLTGVYPWLCTLEVETTMEPTATDTPGYDLSEMPPWAHSVMEKVYLEIPGVEPEELLGIVLDYLGRYNSSETLCRESIEAVEDYGKHYDMITTMKSTLYSLIQDSLDCEFFTDVLQESLELPFAIGNVTGFQSNLEFCEAVENAFRSDNYDEVNLFALRQLIEGYDLSEDQQPFYDLIKFLGRLYNSGSVRSTLRYGCELFEQADFFPDMFESEARRACDWVRYGSEPEGFQSGCVSVVTTPVEGDSEDPGVFDWIGEFFGLFSIEKTFFWLQNIFGINVSSPEHVCGVAKELIANESLTVPVIIDTTMDIFIRHAAHASPWLCKSEFEATAATTGAPGSESTDMPSWAEEFMEDIYMKVPGLDPLEFAKVVFNLLGRYNSSDELCVNSIEAVAEGADPAILDELVVRVKESLYIMMEDVNSCEHFMDVIHESLGLPFSFASLIGVGGNRELCEAFSTVFASEGESSFGERGTAQPREEFHIGQLFDIAGHIDTSGTVMETIRAGCDLLGQLDIVPDELKSGMVVTCAWSRMGSNADIFYEACRTFVTQAGQDKDETPDEEYDSWWTTMEIPDWLQNTLGYLDMGLLSYEDKIVWIKDILELETSSPESFCNSAGDRVEDGSLTIREIFDRAIDSYIRQITGASPWLCKYDETATADPFDGSGFDGSGFDTTEMPEWAETAMENMYLSLPGVDPEELMGVVIQYLGRYNSSEAFCSDATGAVAEGADSEEQERIVRTMKESIYSLIQDVDSCETFMDVLQHSFELTFSFGNVTGFGNHRGLCEAVVDKFNPDNYYEIDVSVLQDLTRGEVSYLDSEEQLPFGELIKIAGRLFNSGTIKDTLREGCDLLYMAGIDVDELGDQYSFACQWSQMESHRESLYYACLNAVTSDRGDENHSNDSGGSWWPDFNFEDLVKYVMGDFWNDVFSLSYSDMIVWMQSQFGLDVSSPEQVCNNAKYFIGEESISPAVSFDAALDFVIRQVASASPWLCMNEPESTAVPEESSSEPKGTDMPWGSSGFKTTEIPPWAYAAYSNVNMDVLGVDPLKLTGEIFSFLGRYDNSDKLCRDTLEAIADDAEPALLDDMVNRMKETVYFLMRDADSCESFIDIVGGSLNLPFSLGEATVFGSNRAICEAVAASSDPEASLDISTLMRDNEQSRDFVLLQTVVRFFNSRNMKDTLLGTCSVLDQFGMIDQLGAEFRVACEWAKMDSTVEIFYYACLDFVKPSYEDLNQGTSVGPAQQIMSWIMDMTGDFGSNTDMFYWMLNFFGFDVSAEEVCDGVNDVFKGKSFNIPVVVDTLAEICIRSTAYATPLLCKDFQDDTPDRTNWDHDFLSTEKPSWYEMEWNRTSTDMDENIPSNDMEEDRPEREYGQEYGRSDEENEEEPDFIGALFTFLGRYQNTNQLCRDSLEAVAVGADPDLLNNMVRTMKNTLYSLMNDARSCNSFIDVIQRSIGVPLPIGQIIGFGSNLGYCEAIHEAFNPHIDNDIDFSAFLILLPAELRPGMDRYGEGSDRYGEGSDRYGEGMDRYGEGSDRYGEGSDRYGEGSDRYGEGMDRYGEGMDRYGEELTTRGLDNGWKDSNSELTTRGFEEGRKGSYSEETTRGYDEEPGWDRSEFTTDSYYRPSSWRGDREDHNEMISPEEHFFIRELIKLNGRLFKSGTIKDIVSMGCDFIDQTYLNLDVLGNGFGELCKFSRLDSDSDDVYFSCLEFFEETGDNNPGECTDGWWTSLLFTGPVDIGPSPTDDSPGSDDENKPWWYNLLLMYGSEFPYQLSELMNSFDGQLFSYEDITKWMEYVFRLDSSSAEQVCASALHTIQDETLTIPVITDKAMDIFIRQVAYASPQLCSEVQEETYETTIGSYQFFPTVMPSEVSPTDLLGIVFTFLGGYENTFQLCRESVQAVEGDSESLDRFVQTMKESIYNLIEDADTCELFLGIMQSSFGLPVSIGEFIGLESNRQICESVAAAFSSDAAVDIDLSAVLALLSPSDIMSYSGPGTEEEYGQWTTDGPAEQFAFGELIKLAGKLYHSGTIMDTLSSSCDLLDQANVAPETFGSEVAIACAWARTEQSLPDAFLPTCVSLIGPAFDDQTDDGQLEEWFANLFSPDLVMSLLKNALLIDSSSPENFCSRQVGHAEDDTATLLGALDTTLQRFIRLILEAAPQLCSIETTDGISTKTDEGRRDVGTVFTVLGLFTDSEEFCQTTLAALEIERYDEDQVQISPLIGRIMDSVYSIRGDLQSCETFLLDIGQSLNLPSSVSEQLGVWSDRALCEAVVGAFDPLSYVDVDISQLFPLILSVANGNELPDVTDLPLLELIRAAGRFINVGNFQSAVRESCDVFFDQFADSLSYIEFDFSSLCDWSRSDSDPDQFYGTCLGWFSTEGGDSDNPGTGVTTFDYSLLYSLQELAEREIGLSLYDPYSICSTFGRTLDTSISDLMEMSKSLVRPFFVSVSEDGNLLSKCTTHTRNFSLFGETFSYTPEGFDNFTITELVFANLAGTFSNGSEFCKFVVDISDDGEMQDAAVTTALENAFNIMHDVSLCNSTTHLLMTNVSDDIFRLFTGFSKENIPTLCTYLYDSFNGGVDPFDLQLPEGFTLEGYVPVVEGELLPGVSFRDIVNLVGQIISTNTLGDSMVVTCDALGPLLDDAVYADLGNLVPLCNALRGADNSVVVTECEKILVPIMYGEDQPIALRPVYFGQLIVDTVFPLFNLTIEDENYCPAIDVLLNSDLTPQQLVVSLIDSWLKIGMEYGAGVCESKEEVFNYLVPDLSWIDPPSGDFYEQELAEREGFVQRFYGSFDLASELAGFASAGEMCNALIAASGDTNVTNALVDAIRETVLTYLTDETACKAAVESLVRFINILDVDISNVFYQVTGYFSPQALCIVSTAAFRGEADTGSDTCFGILDCAGVCNGDASYDCAGFCQGASVRDCAGVCNGQATINGCNECVGGVTGRQQNFGQDRCGTCWSDPNYRITWDCAETCNGTAFVDGCNECVGGDTGNPEDYNDFRIDCKGLCDGSWVEDGCGYCEPISSLSGSLSSSKYMDCAGNCFTPGASSDRAELNHCGVCYGGTTGLIESEGTNACGQCTSDPNADVLSCAGCDGEPNSGKTFDACGICGGNGTTCFGVGWIVPSVVSDGSVTELQVYGAGFDLDSTFACIFENSEGAQTSSDAIYLDYVNLQCNVPGLASGDYLVKVQKDSVISVEEFSTTLTVLPVIEILTVLPSELTINSSVTDFDVTVTASASAFTAVKSTATPYLVVEGDVNMIPTGTFDTESDSIMYFTLPMPSTSIQVTVWPSLNSIDRLTASDGEGFPFTAYYPAPEFTEVYFASSGAALVARFSAGVNFNEITGCNDVFADTSKFGNDAFCRWVGSTTLYIILGTGNDLAAVGDVLALKDGSVKAFRETYSLSASGSQAIGGPSSPIVPTVVLYGTPMITTCGTVKLSGRQSQGGAGRDMVYTWGVSSSGDTSSLEALLADETMVELIVPGSLLDADTIYTFSLTAENFLGESDTASFNVSRSSQAVPEVTIVAKGVDPGQVYVSDSFDLTAEVTFYSDCVPPGETVFSWSVNNDNIPLNLKTINRRSLHVDSNSLPGDSSITFTVTIYKSSEPNNSISQSFTVQTVYSDLVAIIYGGLELTVGRDSGLFVLDGSGSFDLDQVAVDMTYEWQCTQVTDSTACWSFKSGEEGTQFPTSAAAAMSLLSFDASSMEADKTYEFTLVVSKLTRTANTSVMVTALNGNPPKVDITSVTESVKADESLSLAASIYHDLPLSSYVWETVGDELGYSYLNLTDSSNLDSDIGLYSLGSTNGSFTVLSIKGGKLTAGSTYVIQLTATTEDMQYGIAKVQFTVLGDVTSCVFSLDGIDSYNELDSIAYTIDNCVGDESAYPLSYRVFLLDDDILQTITEKTNDPSISGIGKPVSGDSASNTFVAEVCDTSKSCAYFYHTVNVTANLQCTDDEVASLTENLVTVEKFKQNFAAAFINYNTIQQKCSNSTSARRRRRSVVDTSSDVAIEQLSLVTSVIDNTVLDVDSAQFLIDQCSYINTDELTVADKSTFIDIFVTLLAVFESAGESVPEGSAAIIVNKAIEIRRSLNSTHNADTLSTITNLIDSLSQAQVSDLSLGAAALETISSALTSSVQRAIPSGAFSSKSSGGNIIDFGSALGDIFNAAWACSSGTCSGVTVNFEHWATGEDDFSVSAEDRANVAADITDVKLLDPSSGDELSIANLTELISITLSVTQPQSGKSYECRYWDTDTSTWATDGLETVIDSSDTTQVECLTDHLTPFTLLAVEGTTVMPTTEMDTYYPDDATTVAEATTPAVTDPIELPTTEDSSTIIIIVVVVVVVVVILLVIIAVVVVLKKKKGKNAIDPNGNIPMAHMEEARTVEQMQVTDGQWAAPQRPPTPRQPTTAVQVVAVPVALETANIESLSSPPSPQMVADMNDVAPPPVYLPPSQNTDSDTAVYMTQVS